MISGRQIDNQNSKEKKPNIPPRPKSLKPNSKMMTSDISTHLPSNKDMTLGNTFRQKHIQIPTPTPRHDRYNRQDKLSSPPPQIFPYD